jgi:hypothetical protein
MLTEEQVKRFLEELAALSIKHGIDIGGCGCCRSPYLSELEATEGRYVIDANFNPKFPLLNHLTWSTEEH